jgi:hypothetical protein
MYPVAPDVPEKPWARYPMGKVLTDHIVSLQTEPPIKLQGDI